MVFTSHHSELKQKIKGLVENKRVSWKKHALKRMLERKLKRHEVFEALIDCQIVESHKLRRPFQTYLVLGFYNKKPIHVMLAIHTKDDMLWIITVYVPSIKEWQSDFRTRRKK